ncbi:MAG TPA: hypothetical protein VGF55_05840 [Gemmataceae bacterium]|jgi:hypothetical protein
MTADPQPDNSGRRGGTYVPLRAAGRTMPRIAARFGVTRYAVFRSLKRAERRAERKRWGG